MFTFFGTYSHDIESRDISQEKWTHRDAMHTLTLSNIELLARKVIPVRCQFARTAIADPGHAAIKNHTTTEKYLTGIPVR